MNIKVITRHAPTNYGSLLQSIATVKSVERLGHSCEIIDYIREDEKGMKSLLTILNNKKNWSKNPLKRFIYLALRFPGEFLAVRKFAKMRKEVLKLTKPYNNLADLSSIESDIFMTGSDQVWGAVATGGYDEAYFLSFAGKTAKKIAFASSFGKTDINNQTLSAYRDMLKEYSNIAVREKSAVKIIEDAGIKCEGQVLDPTLLLTKTEWQEFITKEIEGNFIVVYQLHSNPQFDDYAKRFAAEVNMPLIRVSPSLHQIFRGGKFAYLPNLGEFLSYIKNCRYFITDSFHGTAFALNFNKEFIEILPNNNTGTRNISILNLTGLEDRVVTDFNNFSIADKPIDYNRVNAILDAERKKSIEILTRICST